jgi:diguanylate cyclase (GGDEF)-like protein
MTFSSSPIACLLSQGEQYLVTEDFTQALDLFEHALALAQQTHNTEAEVFVLQQLSNIHLEQGQPALARAAVEQALAIALERIDNQSSYAENAANYLTEVRKTQFTSENPITRDWLTRIYNRSHFFALAQRELGQASRFSQPVTLLMIDIDHFKEINHIYGYLTGDQVLREVALRLRNNLRKTDILARYGGEKFIVLMPKTTQAHGWQGAERLRQIIAQRPLPITNTEISLTVSIGVTSWMATPTTVIPSLEDLIKQANQALYRAKQAGRNQTQVAPCPIYCAALS